MREDHHTFEPHTETADDHFCDRCFGHHHWDDGCPETDDDDDDEPLDLIPARGQLEVKVDAGGPVSHTVKAYYVPRDATEKAVKDAIRYWLPREFCQHEYDCCGRYYPDEGQLIGRTYADDGRDVVFVLRTYIMNV
jgi:hypothetical protein